MQNAVSQNTQKRGLTQADISNIAANTRKKGITTAQSNAIVANTAKVGVSPTLANNVSNNTLKVGITQGQASAIIANTRKKGITTAQSNAIVANTAKVGVSPALANAVSQNTLKQGITPQQATLLTQLPAVSTRSVTNSTAIVDLRRGQDAIAPEVTANARAIIAINTKLTPTGIFNIWSPQLITGRGIRVTLGTNRATIYVDPQELSSQVLLAGDNINFRVVTVGGVSRLQINAVIPSTSGSGSRGSGS